MFPTPDYDMETETTEPQRRLPRSFVDDPFFNNSDVFRDFPRDFPSRRFGSNPRIFDDAANSFFNDFEPRASFHSLPRRANSRSPGPNQEDQPRSGGNQGPERPIPVHRQYQTEKSPGQSTTIPVRIQRQEESPKRAPNQRSSPPHNVNFVTVDETKRRNPSGEIKEINNAQSTANYTNGALNPDRKAHSQQVSQQPTPNQDIPTITINSPVDSPPEKKFVKADSTEKQQQEIVDNVEEKMEKKEVAPQKEIQPPTRRLGKGFSLDGCSDKLLDLLDDAERRVEMLRETAAQLEQEKEQLLDTLNNVKINVEYMRLNQGEQEDILINADRILNRCKAVDVFVSTPRNEHQAKALEEVNYLLQGVINKMQEDLSNSKETVKRYLNACNPDQPDGPIDQKFQAKIIECTADDQKKIRRKLAQIITQIERAERVVPSP